MNLTERSDLVEFNQDEVILIKKIIKKRKLILFILSIWILFCWYGSNLEKRSRQCLILENPGYAILSFLVAVAIIGGLYYIFIHPLIMDYYGGQKLKMQTKVKDYRKTKHGIDVKVTNSHFDKVWLHFITYEEKLDYGSWILLGMFPKSKLIFKYKIKDI